MDANHICPKCCVPLKKYDTVKRIVRGKNHSKKIVSIERYRCPKCQAIHRILPGTLYPYKQYEADIIDGVIQNLIDPDTLGFEDFPCEQTMKRWKKQGIKPKL